MANAPMRRSANTGSHFGWFMLAIVVFLILLLWYGESNQQPEPMAKPAGLLHAA